MNSARLDAVVRAQRRRRMAIVFAFGVPLVVALAALVLRVAGAFPAIMLAAFAMLVVIVHAVRQARACRLTDVVRQLDARLPAFEDSGDLLLRETAALAPLQRLQQARLRERLAATTLPDLRMPWPQAGVWASWGVAVVAILAAWQWPPARTAEPDVPVAQTSSIAAPSTTTLGALTLDIDAPAYTGLAARREATLDAEAPEGSRLRWSLHFDTTPSSVTLVFHDGERLALAHEGEVWQGARVLTVSTLYRIELEGAPALAEDALHRLEAIRDRAPELHVIEPDRTLTVLERGQSLWNLAFEASDDYGIAGARLAVTLAQGSGEQITVKQQDIALRAEAGGEARQRRYRHRLDLAALGFAQGDDVIVRLAISDNRQPQANVTRSASFILRWPPEASAEADGIDGVVQKVLPAYFRSQRQIIIDTEALLAEKPKLAADAFLKRSDAIGVDQKILRLRYGQFLGEEFESGAAPKSAAKHEETPAAHADHDAHEDGGALPEGHTHDDGHDHAEAAFGDAGGLVAEYGHTHDHAEAATLLDPETKRILKAALDEMWQAELKLRIGEPHAALPYENRALDYIKQVQQASRIYLARVGLELPEVDLTRRLSGDRKGAAAPRDLLASARPDDAVVTTFAAALARGEATDAAAFSAWLREHEHDVPDALGVFAALDAWQRDADCAACRERLLDRVWPLLPTPPTAVMSRPRATPAGDAYLDALQAEQRR